METKEEIFSIVNLKTEFDTPLEELSEANIFGLNEKDLDMIMSNFCLYISNVDFKKLKTIEETIAKFVEIENNVLDFLKNNKSLKINQKKILEMLTEEMIEQKFIDKENYNAYMINKNNEISYLKINDKITEEEYKHYFDFLLSDAMKKKELENEEIDASKIQCTFQEIYNIVSSLYISDLCERIRVSEIPKFLVKKNTKKLKHKIKFVFNPFIKEYYHLYIENKIEVKVLKNFYHSFSIKAIDIFDFTSLKPELIDILFKIFILSNVDYLQRDEISLSYFYSNFAKYSKIMHMEKVMKEEDHEYSYFSNKLLAKIKNDLFELPKKEREDLLTLNLQILRNYVKDYNEKYFFIIFSFSFMLNNIIVIEKGNQVVNGKLNCNSRERQLLHNVLKVFYNNLNLSYNSFEINSYVQSLVINNILKASCPDIFDSQLQLKKYFTMEVIEDVIKNCCENKIILEEFEKLSNIHTMKTTSGIKGYFQSILKSTFTYYMQEEKIDLTTVTLKSLDQFSLSTNLCLCVSGFTSDGMDQQRAWENFTLDMNKYIDLYYFNWPSETFYSFIKDILYFVGNSVLNFVREDYLKLITDTHGYATSSNLFHKAKKNAKVCGKLLAHVIASRTIFKFQTINLIGFSLGSHLIKHCIKELDRLTVHDQSLRNVIQNVVFVAGATHFKNHSKWVERFKSLVAGRIINCHGANDHILKFLFKITTRKDAIGFKPIDFNYEIFENWDFTHLSVGHLDYRKHMDYILKTIKLY